MKSKETALILVPNFKVREYGPDELAVDEKSLDGLKSYCEYWNGPVKVLVERDDSPSRVISERRIGKRELPFQVVLTELEALSVADIASHGPSIFLISVGYRTNKVGWLCHRLGIPYVYITEYSLATRKKIILLSESSLIKRGRRYAWEIRQEKKQAQVIKAADGVQCNGFPTYEAYKAINANSMIYFDNRVKAGSLASRADIDARYERLDDRKPISLVFSGRLDRTKGADHLVHTAALLKRRKVNFKMYICGAGELEEEINREVEINGLAEFVELTGVLEFDSQLLPFMKTVGDLFVCCHRQGDPSCTYLETMACGVPIVGYANEAWAGLMRYAGAGWLVEAEQPAALAGAIERLNRVRPVIRAMAHKSLEFASRHTFERTFAARVDHVRDSLNRSIEGRG